MCAQRNWLGEKGATRSSLHFRQNLYISTRSQKYTSWNTKKKFILRNENKTDSSTWRKGKKYIYSKRNGDEHTEKRTESINKKRQNKNSPMKKQQHTTQANDSLAYTRYSIPFHSMPSENIRNVNEQTHQRIPMCSCTKQTASQLASNGWVNAKARTEDQYSYLFCLEPSEPLSYSCCHVTSAPTLAICTLYERIHHFYLSRLIYEFHKSSRTLCEMVADATMCALPFDRLPSTTITPIEQRTTRETKLKKKENMNVSVVSDRWNVNILLRSKSIRQKNEKKTILFSFVCVQYLILGNLNWI